MLGGLEAGLRKTISVSEVFALAYVLDVPPLLLIAPVATRARDVEVLPGISVDPWSVVRWAAGEGFHGQLDDASHPSTRPRSTSSACTGGTTGCSTSGTTPRTSSRSPPPGHQEPERAPALTQIRADHQRTSPWLRRLIRQHGAQPPPLPVQLQYLDERQVARRCLRSARSP